MKKILKLASLMLALLTVFSSVPFAFAAGDTAADEAAQALNTLGLLAGKGTNADGSINFDVSGSLTRAESITQVVRFLGAEKAATTETNAHPFTDLPSWAVPYISYAYVNKITSGVSATKFDAASAMTDYAFLTAILRVLGYKDAEGDFVWNNPYALAKSVGLIESETPDESFTRGDAFIICFNALTAAVKSGDKLCDSLVKNGTVDAALMASVTGANKECNLTVNGVNFTDFTVVIGENANATEKVVANNLIEAVKTTFGVTLPLVTDSSAKSANEIIIGKTARAESAFADTLGEEDVGMAVSGTTIALAGLSNSTLRRTVTFFIDEYINTNIMNITDDNTYKGKLITNPVRAFGQNGDPCIVYDNETEYYYALYSAPQNDRVILYRSKTLAGLGTLDTADGKEIYVAGENKEVKHKLYAPELKKMNGKWYIYASGATSWDDRNGGPANPNGGASPSIRLFCLEATSDDPYGEYKFKAFLDPDIFAIDAHPFTYNGENYIAFARIRSGNIISVAKLSDPWTIDASKVTVIATATYDFETISGNINEGPFTFVSPDGRLFLLYSANNVTSDNYSLGILEFTGDNILSSRSWTKHKEAVFKGTENIKSPGHCSVFMSPDGTEYWLAYHYQSSGRKLGAQKFTFDETGFPSFGDPKAPGVGSLAPSGE